MEELSGPNGPASMTAAELANMLQRWDMNDANAARLLGVTSWTVKQWQRSGLSGPAAVFLRTIHAFGISPWDVARMLGVPLSGLGRRGYRAEAPERMGGLPNAEKNGTGTENQLRRQWPSPPNVEEM